MQILRPHLRPNVSDILGFEPSNESDKNSGDFNTYSKLRLTALNWFYITTILAKDFYSNYFPGLKGTFIQLVVSFCPVLRLSCTFILHALTV